MRTGTPARHLAMISVEYLVSVMNQNDTSSPTVSARIILMMLDRQSSKETSHRRSCAEAVDAFTVSVSSAQAATFQSRRTRKLVVVISVVFPYIAPRRRCRVAAGYFANRVPARRLA